MGNSLTATQKLTGTTPRSKGGEQDSIAAQNAKLQDLIGELTTVEHGEVKNADAQPEPSSPNTPELPAADLSKVTGAGGDQGAPDLNAAAAKAQQQGLTSMRAGDLRNMRGATSSAFKAKAVGSTDPKSYELKSKRFSDPVFKEILAGETTMKAGDKSDAVRVVQASLYSLGYDSWPDRDFGEKATKPAVEAFQRDNHVEPTGEIDGDTLVHLDQRAAEQTARLKAAELEDGKRSSEYRVVLEIGQPGVRNDAEDTHAYVVDKNGDIAARYAISPGDATHMVTPRETDVKERKVRWSWVPTASMQMVRKSKGQPPLRKQLGGPDNPMGLVKNHLFNAVYLHGIPLKRKDKLLKLGDKASHGCFRMSPTNILEMTEKYIEPGSKVSVVYDAEELDKQAEARGIETRDRYSAGREYLGAYMGGEMGEDASKWSRQPGGS